MIPLNNSSVVQPLYHFGHLCDRIDQLRSNRVEQTAAAYLAAGAHTLFLENGIAFGCLIQAPNRTKHIMRSLIKSRAWPQRPPFAPEPSEQGYMAAASRLYYPDGNPRLGLDPGIMHGAAIESYVVCTERIRTYGDHLSTDRSMPTAQHLINNQHPQILERFLAHPEADLLLLINLDICYYTFSETFGADSVQVVLATLETRKQFLMRRLVHQGIEGMAQELVSLWWDHLTTAFWAIFVAIIVLPFHDLFPDIKRPFTKFLKAMLAAAHSEHPYLGDRARDALYFLPSEARFENEMLTASLARGAFFRFLRSEMPHPEAFHAFLSFLAGANRKQFADILFSFGIFKGKDAYEYPEEAKFFLTTAFCKELWDLCVILQGFQYWEHIRYMPGGPKLLAGFKKEDPIYMRFLAVAAEFDCSGHDGTAAEALDLAVTASGLTVTKADYLIDEGLNLLSGDIVVTVTHLMATWMQIDRSATELLGTVITHIEIANREDVPEFGASCRFQVYIQTAPDHPIRGVMDADGAVTFENIAALLPLSVRAIQAIVIQSLQDLLIPQYRTNAPARSMRRHGRIPTKPYRWDTEPTVQLVTDFRQDGLNEYGKKERMRGREWEGRPDRYINPLLAHFLFSWLLGLRPNTRFLIFQRNQVRVGKSCLSCFELFPEAVQKLREGLCAPEEVYIRVARAHTMPLKVRRKRDHTIKLEADGTILVCQMSPFAKKNYRYHLAHGGRPLDLRPIIKQVIVSDKESYEVLIPRTFNQGTFCSFSIALTALRDEDLYMRACEFLGIKPLPLPSVSSA